MNLMKKISKLRISLSGQDGKMPSQALRRKIEEDPELYHHWKSEQGLTGALRERGGDPVPVPADLRARILARVADEEPAGRGVPTRNSWQLAAIAAVLAFGAVFVLLQKESPRDTEEFDVPVIENMQEQPGAPITLETPLENHPLVQLSSLIESPLREEPQRLLDDAENALRFLGNQFMPSEQWRSNISRRFSILNSRKSENNEV